MKSNKVMLICCFMVLIFIYAFLCRIDVITARDSTDYQMEEVEKINKIVRNNSEDEIIHTISLSFENKVDLDDLRNEIIDLCDERIDDIGFIYYDLNSRDSVMINEDKLFCAASTIKVPLVMMLYDDFFYGYSDPDDKVSYMASDYEEGCGILSASDLLYEPFSLSTLGEYSIMYSDNVATNMIFRSVSGNFRGDYLYKITGMESDNNNFITPSSMLKILLKLYENEENNPYYETLIDDMKNTVFNDRISLYIPSSIVAHKIGDYENCVNDVGIVYTDNPYIIIFYTEGFEYSKIAEISKLVYEFQQKR